MIVVDPNGSYDLDPYNMAAETEIIPVSVLTGYLGAGKTTTLLAVLPLLPPNYKIALIKNEFGDVEVDSLLFQQTQRQQDQDVGKSSSFQVKEMMNGCMCCVLVGQLSLALKELKEVFHPDRIVVETSGSAFPAPIAWQIRQLSNEGFYLDAILTVVDCMNFRGYEDVSYTAKMQAQYTDLILLNKHNLVSERDLDLVVDRINDLNTDTPKIKINPKTGSISPNLLFGLDSRLFTTQAEVDALSHDHQDDHDHHDREVDVITVLRTTPLTPSKTPQQLVEYFTSPFFPKDYVFRVKGFLVEQETVHVLNIAFGRPDGVTKIAREILNAKQKQYVLQLTLMGVSLASAKSHIQRDLFPDGENDGNDGNSLSLHSAH